MTQEARYYYTDPLAAAWMAKHHGLVLELAYTEEEIIEYDLPNKEQTYYFRDAMVGEGSADMWSEVIEAKCRKIYVAEESLPLLQPQVGDLLLDDDITDGAKRTWHLDGMTESMKNKWRTIIQRNGTPFIMPEIEYL